MPLITVAELGSALALPAAPAVLDVRWSLDGGGRAGYAAGHLPGAVFLDLDADLAAPPGAGGRHPLPDPARLQRTLRALGVGAGPVVVYDAGGVPPTGAAARAWWTLRWAGLADVRVLDGGFAAWVADGRPVHAEEVRPAPGDVTLRPGVLPVLDAAQAARLAGAGALVDARVPARYRGEVEPVDAVAGRIPGAHNLPAGDTVGPDGRLLPAAQLRRRVAALELPAGVRPGVYCGSGITAAQVALAMTVAGHPPALYVGSWSEWITDPARPVETGQAA